MELRIFRFLICLAITTILVVGSISAASAYYAAAVSSNRLYNLTADSPGGAITGATLYDFVGSNLGGVAVLEKSNGTFIFVSDTTDSGGRLHVLQLTKTGSTINTSYKGSIKLSNGDNKVMTAGAVAVDGNGGVYITDKAASSSAHYAYLTNSNWADPSGASMTLESLGAYYPQVGIAAGDASGATILASTGIRLSPYTIKVNGASLGTATEVDSSGSSKPSAIAINKSTDSVYVATRPSDPEMTGGSVFSMGSAGAAMLPGIPHSVSVLGDATADVADDYLAVIGKGASGGLQAWLMSLAAGSATSVVSSIVLDGSDNSIDHYSAATTDGAMLWFTSPASQSPYSERTVGTIDVTNWLSGSPVSTTHFLGLPDGVGAIASYDNIALVPEPSSLISLMGLAAGTLGMLRRRRPKQKRCD